MITARPYWNLSDSVEFRRLGRGMPHPGPQSFRDGSMYDSVEVTSSRLSPASDEGKMGGPPRRRIAVACGRCRKRKIKCSGDPGNGTGCNNCKTSGTSHCQFLRVNSEECHLPGSRALGVHGWQYGHTVSSSTVPPMTLAQISGSVGSSRSHGLSMVPSSSHYSTRQTGYPYYGGSLNRLAYSPYEEDSQYSVQPPSPAYMIPSSDQISVGLYTTAESPKPQWTLGDATSYPSSAYSYTPSPLSTVSSAANPLFPVVNSAVPSITNGRILPAPMPDALRSHSINGMPSSVLLTDYFPPGSSATAYKTSGNWAQDSIGSGNISSSSSGSTRTLSVDTASSGPISSSKASSTGQDMSFGYIPISHSPTALPMASTAPFTTSDSAESPQNVYCTANLPRISSREDLASPQMSEDYAHDANGNGKRARLDQPSRNLLSNGAQYQRLPDPNDYSQSYRTTNIAELHEPIEHAHRTEVSNTGAY